MATYKDFSFDLGDDGLCQEYTGTDAMILAIRNILLSKPGNYPLTPSLGMNISKYQFDLIDDSEIRQIKSDLAEQIGKYIPNADDVSVEVSKISNTLSSGRTQYGLGIQIWATVDGTSSDIALAVTRKDGLISIAGEEMPTMKS